jgi:hypothetical protein
MFSKSYFLTRDRMHKVLMDKDCFATCFISSFVIIWWLWVHLFHVSESRQSLLSQFLVCLLCLKSSIYCFTCVLKMHLSLLCILCFCKYCSCICKKKKNFFKKWFCKNIIITNEILFPRRNINFLLLNNRVFLFLVSYKSNFILIIHLKKIEFIDVTARPSRTVTTSCDIIYFWMHLF